MKDLLYTLCHNRQSASGCHWMSGRTCWLMLLGASAVLWHAVAYLQVEVMAAPPTVIDNPATTTAAPPQAAAVPQAERWNKELAAFDKENTMHPQRTGGLVFCGSSTIRLWKLKDSFPEYSPINRGFGGSRYDDLVRHAEGILKPLQPAVLVIYSGDNDIAAKQSSGEVVQNFEKFHTWVRTELPETKIIVLGIKPSVKRWEMIESIRETNSQLAKICGKDPQATFIDTETVMLGADGKPIPELFVADGLHMSEEGYRRWAQLLKPYLAVIHPPQSTAITK